MDEPPREEMNAEETRRWTRGISWLLAGLVLLLAGFASMGGGYAFTAMSTPLFLTALIFGSRGIRIAAGILLVAGFVATATLYSEERAYWPRAHDSSQAPDTD